MMGGIERIIRDNETVFQQIYLERNTNNQDMPITYGIPHE